MTRNEERLVWIAVQEHFSPQVLAAWVLEDLQDILGEKSDRELPRLVSLEGLAEAAALILDDIAHQLPPMPFGQRALHRDHPRILRQFRKEITGKVVARIPADLLTPRLSEIRVSVDLGL